MSGHRFKYLAVLSGAAAAVMVVAACSSGVSQADYDALKKQADDQKAQVSTLQQQVATLQGEVTKKTGEASAAIQTAAAKEAATKGVIMAAVPSTPAPPRATATPGPTPTPWPANPATARPIVFNVDTATASPSSLNVAATASCIRLGNFKRGLKILWRAQVFDATTGKEITAADVDTFNLILPDGTTKIKMKYGPHGTAPDRLYFWTTSWDVPMDYPVGPFKYRLDLATANGKQATYQEYLATAVNIVE